MEKLEYGLPNDSKAAGLNITLQDKANSVQTMFTAIADRYDLLNSLLSFRGDGAWRRFAASKTSLQPGSLALDVGTGTGELLWHLARGNNGSTIVGIDFCPEMLKKAEVKYVSSPDKERMHLLLSDALRLPFLDNTFDTVTISFVLRNVTDITSAFREMARVVKGGGRVVSLELTRPSSALARALYYFYIHRIAPHIGGLLSGQRAAYTYLPESILEFPSPGEVKEIMQQAGLQRIETHRLTLGTATVHTGIKEG
jgi:demethylmenaquinone methyltransferase/2-methoxy-6-polyprenyl-1,4-benzoquinol methylase